MQIEAPHPGEYIKEELDERGLSQRDLAYIIGVTEQTVSKIIAGKSGVSPEMAKLLGAAFDVSPDLFANLQRAFDMSRAKDPDPGVVQRARLSSAYPVREMISRGWLGEGLVDGAHTMRALASFFEVDGEDEIPHLKHAAKKTRYDEILPEQLAWLFRVRQIARGMPTVGYSEKALRDALSKLKTFLGEPTEARQVPRLLADCGVRFVLCEALPKMKADGVCFWLDKQSPVIGMSLFYDRIDNFWFVLRHEIEHVLNKDGQDYAIIDSDLQSPSSEEQTELPPEEVRANRAAADFCIPKDKFDSFFIRKAPFFSERDVLAFAKRVETHPGIVVGQIQKRLERWDLLRKHLVKVRHHVMPAAIVDGWGQVAIAVKGSHHEPDARTSD